MKITLFIGTLKTGGAERQLVILAKGLAKRGHKVTIITIYPGGQMTEELLACPDTKVMSLWSRKGGNIIIRILQLASSPIILRSLTKNSETLYSMLETSNFIAWLATRLRAKPLLVWGVRSSNMKGHWKMAIFDKLCALVSPTVKLLIANSHAGLKCLLNRGYRPQTYLVIPNGIDTARFQFDGKARKRIRSEIGITSDQLLIGIVGRLTPIKDQPTFLKAAALVAKEMKNVRFVCVGAGPADYAEKLRTLSKKLAIEGKLTWLGERRDMPAIYSALDLLASSSYGEGFPNVIGEAMACSVPCVVTDVGDSGEIVGNSDCIVLSRNSKELAQAIVCSLKNQQHLKSKVICRKRIIKKYSAEMMVIKTEELFEKNL